MNKKIKFILAVFALAAAIIYFALSSIFVSGKQQTLVCKSIDVNVADNYLSENVDSEDIKKKIINSGEPVLGVALNKINTFNLEKLLKGNSAIKSVNIYTTKNGVLNVKIEQRKPILRVQCENAKFFIDENGYMFPMTMRTTLYLPVVTGKIKTVSSFVGNVQKNDQFLQQLYNFAMFLNNNNFWNSAIEQINVNGDKIELIPQIGRHTIKLGTLDNFESKLEKLRKFYINAMPSIGWNTYKTINIEYKNQIICKK